MKKLFLSLCLLGATIDSLASITQEILTQEDVQKRYNQLTDEQKKTLEAFYGKIEDLLYGMQVDMQHIMAENKEGVALLKKIMNGKELELTMGIHPVLQDDIH